MQADIRICGIVFEQSDMHGMSRRGSPSRESGFTLVEVLVAVGIIALLVALLLPSLSRVRTEARAVHCASQIRQICGALIGYASDNRGCFPPNVAMPGPGIYWCDIDRIGQYLPNQSKLTMMVGGGVMVCPEDGGSVRSYSMNHWASSRVTASVQALIPAIGELWRANVRHSSQMILVTEQWSSVSISEIWYTAPATLGLEGDLPGQRFGGAGGLSPELPVGRFGMAKSEITFSRHRKARTRAVGNEPIGRVNIGYADGHVELKSDYELVDPVTGRSTQDSQWCPRDPDLEP
jgi:prepilin-type N-terminal cleavage/methylation domain-containing protein/prepilin-type processing-associated H-X9-DG protein